MSWLSDMMSNPWGIMLLRQMPAAQRMALLSGQFNQPSLAGKAASVFTPVDSFVNTAVGAPVVGAPHAEALVAQTAEPNLPVYTPPAAAPAAPAAAAPAPAAPINLRVASPNIEPARVVTLPVAPGAVAEEKAKKPIKVDNLDAAKDAYAAGVVGGDSGILLDPLGRRGRGMVGRTSLLGR